MDPDYEVNLTAYEKLDEKTDTTEKTPSSPSLIRIKPKRDKSPKSPPPKKKTKASGKKKPKKRKTKRKVKKSKRKTKTKARGKSNTLVNEQFMKSLTDDRYVPDNRSGIQFIENQSYGMNPDGSRITPRVEGKNKTTRTIVSSSKPTIKKTRKHK